VADKTEERILWSDPSNPIQYKIGLCFIRQLSKLCIIGTMKSRRRSTKPPKPETPLIARLCIPGVGVGYCVDKWRVCWTFNAYCVGNGRWFVAKSLRIRCFKFCVFQGSRVNSFHRAGVGASGSLIPAMFPAGVDAKRFERRQMLTVCHMLHYFRLPGVGVNYCR
jgi:hypothetical protein